MNLLTFHSQTACRFRCLRCLALILVLSLSLAALPALQPTARAAETAAETSDLHVISDEMIAEQENSTVEFVGNVKATREDSVLLADSVKVYFHDSPDKADNRSNVKQIVATGNVEYTAGERKAVADKAIYTTENDILVLTGKSPKLLTGKSWVTGKKITLFRNEERVMVESDGKTRVEAFFDSRDRTTPTDRR